MNQRSTQEQLRGTAQRVNRLIMRCSLDDVSIVTVLTEETLVQTTGLLGEFGAGRINQSAPSNLSLASRGAKVEELGATSPTKSSPAKIN